MIGAGGSERTAAALAASTIAAERHGKTEVGASHLLDYLDALREGRLFADANPVVEQRRSAAVVVDAGGGTAQAAFDAGFTELVDAARTAGTSVLSVRNAYSAGELGYYARRLAEAGLVAIVCGNSPALMGVYSAARPVTGTNPLAFALPNDAAGPRSFDQASSATAWVNVRSAADRSEPIPEGWAVEAHTEGLPVRVVTGGLATMPGDSIEERRQWFIAHSDHLRTFLMNEPRGHGTLSGAILQPPTVPDADWGVLFIEVTGVLPMCGAGTIAVATVLVDTGMVAVTEPVTVVRLDTPVGIITAHVAVRDGKAQSVRIVNVPSFAVALDQRIDVPGLGDVPYDLAYGGGLARPVTGRHGNERTDGCAARARRARARHRLRERIIHRHDVHGSTHRAHDSRRHRCRRSIDHGPRVDHVDVSVPAGSR